jgi:hypothetical protein
MLGGLVALMIVAGLVGVAQGDGSEWPEFHGPKRDNISEATGLLKEWPEDGRRKVGA